MSRPEVPLLPLLLLLCAGPAQAGDADVPRPELSLLPAWSHATPGTDLEVGLHFDLPEGWHIYWTNPGDSGLATDATISGPAGAAVSPIRFPAPRRFESAGDIVNYGYEGSTALFATIAVPEGQKGPVVAHAQARWLLCRERCVMQEGTASVRVPPAKKRRPPAPAHVEELAQARARVPTPLVDVLAVRKERRGEGFRYEVAIDGRLPAELFPSAELELLLDDHVWRWEDGALVLRLDGRFDPAAESVAAVLSLKQHGGTRWYSLDVPVSPADWSDAPDPQTGEPE